VLSKFSQTVVAIGKKVKKVEAFHKRAQKHVALTKADTQHWWKPHWAIINLCKAWGAEKIAMQSGSPGYKMNAKNVRKVRSAPAADQSMAGTFYATACGGDA
jgi:hypothetical protein